MKWFGKRWVGEVCSLPETTNPGGNCHFCKEPLDIHDQGFILDFGACHKKCLSRAIKGKTWVDHDWTTKMHSLWDRGWTCAHCGVVAFADPGTKEGREKNRRERGIIEDCTAQLVDGVSKL